MDSVQALSEASGVVSPHHELALDSAINRASDDDGVAVGQKASLAGLVSLPKLPALDLGELRFSDVFRLLLLLDWSFHSSSSWQLRRTRFFRNVWRSAIGQGRKEWQRKEE